MSVGKSTGGYVTPVGLVGDGATYISWVREDLSVENGRYLCCVLGNLRKGARSNPVHIKALPDRKNLQKSC